MEDLRSKTCKELRDIAKELGIVGRWDMNKKQLIDAISHKDKNKIQSEGPQNVTKATEDYIKNIKPGTLVAFKLDENKDIAMSGKFVKFDNDGNLIIESKKGNSFTLNQKSIIWVKTGTRWPRWVFNMFNKVKLQEVEIDNAIS